MNWNRSEVLALAKVGCAKCGGNGMDRCHTSQPCRCVLRAIFDACHRKFRQITEMGPNFKTVQLERTPGAINGPMAFGRKNEEYRADFTMIAKRVLTNPVEYQIFTYHFLLGADWKLCCKRLNMVRGDFFHVVYRVKERLGRVYRELEPYGLFPLDEYFGGSVRTGRTMASGETKVASRPVRAPLAPHKVTEMPTPALDPADAPLAA